VPVILTFPSLPSFRPLFPYLSSFVAHIFGKYPVLPTLLGIRGNDICHRWSYRNLSLGICCYCRVFPSNGTKFQIRRRIKHTPFNTPIWLLRLLLKLVQQVWQAPHVEYETCTVLGVKPAEPLKNSHMSSWATTTIVCSQNTHIYSYAHFIDKQFWNVIISM
jgi:hypothetical protein